MTDPTTICVLTTVNAPYASNVDAAALALALRGRNISLGQVASFLTEVPKAEQIAFAALHGVDQAELAAAASAFAAWSGQSVPLAA